MSDTPTTVPTVTPKNPGADIPYELFLDCVHCGLCTAACPTYVMTGNENDSPRGRIHLMRAVTDERIEMNDHVRNHLELCLDCRACETACPSGVQYGKLIEPFRIAMDQAEGEESASHDWFHRWVLFGLFPYASRLRTSLIPARILQRIGLYDLVVKVSRLFMPKKVHQLMEMLPAPGRSEPDLPSMLPAKGTKRARVALFTGCVGDAMFRPTNWATARVLQENGCEVVIPKKQGCCGAIHFHAGSDDPAREMADANLQAFDIDSVDAIIVNVAGCGAMLKDYGHHWSDDKTESREKFAAKVKDIHEFLDELGLIPPTGEINIKATYHDACHLGHAQKIKEQPRNLLAQIPGLKMVPLPETDLCCGAAGTYNLTQPEMAEQLGQRKLDNILSTGAQTVITANAGCLLQIARHAKTKGEVLRVIHPMDILDRSYQGESLDS